MTKQQIKVWQQESIQQAVVRLTSERYTELQNVLKAAGEVS